MEINCEFQPCEDCESRHHCWKYWKYRAFISARAYKEKGPFRHIEELLNTGLTRADRIKCWETYLRNEKELLRDHKGEYVAIYNGNIVGISNSSDVELAKMLYDSHGAVEAFIYKIEEEDEETIQMPPYVGNIVEL